MQATQHKGLKSCLAAFFFVLAPLLLSAQKIIYVDTTFSVFVPKTLFGEINLSTCTDSVFDDKLTLQFAYDIAVNAAGEMYVYGVLNGWLDTVFLLALYPPGNVYWPPSSTTISHEIRGLTCDENGFFYSAGKGITKRNTNCCYDQISSCCDKWKETYLGTLPPDMQCQGDITYRRGKFYLSAIGNKLVEVNMKDPSKSQIVYEFPPGTLPIQGLTTVQLGCDSVVTYAIGRAWNHSIIYELDFDNWTLTQVCNMPLRAIDGTGNKTECALPPCDIFIDLDDDNSSFGYWGNYCADPACLPPMSVADTDVVILSTFNTLDSLVLVLHDALDGNYEYLQANVSNPDLSVTGDGTATLIFINNGTALTGDFEAALKSVLYQNDAPVHTYGMRKVKVTGWANGIKSIASTAELPLDNNVLQTTALVSGPSCFGEQDGSMEVQTTGGTGPYSYQWTGGPSGNTLENIGAGTYQFVVADSAGCINTVTIEMPQPDSLVAAINYDGPASACNAEAELTAVVAGGTGPYAYDWGNGVFDEINVVTAPGNYSLMVTDSNGCQASAAFAIAPGDSTLTVESVQICSGETHVWNAVQWAADTLACFVWQLAGGCDSTSCLQLTVHPLPALSLTADGNLCGGGPVALSATGQHTAWLWQDGSTGPGLSTDQPGTYSVTVTNAQGCTASASLTLTAGVEYEVTATGPACTGDTDGRIAFQNTSGGTPPLQFSIDGGQTFSSSTVFENLPPGTYSLVVEDAAGCRTESEALLVEPTVILLDAGEDLSIRLGESVTLSAQTNLVNPLVLWQPPDNLDCPDCLSTVASPVKTTVYEVEITDPNGCKARDAVRVAVDGRRRVYVPTAFSPNGDGINDRLTVFSDVSVSQVLSLQIFDRWGGLVYEGRNLQPNDTTTGWDGTVNGEAVQPGTYVYVLRLQLTDGTEEWMEGEVVVVRN